MSSTPIVLTAVGDLMFSGVVRERMEVAGDMAWSLRPVQEVLGRGDVLFGNFEFPVSVARRAEPGCKPERVSPSGIGRALRDAGFHVVNFAQNHLYDFGAEGVECTLREMADGGPACVGVGRNAAEARRPVVIDTASGKRIGFLAYATAHMAVDCAHEYVAGFPHIPTVQADVAALRSRREETRRTFFVRIALDGDRVASHEIVPCSIGDDGRTVVADGDLGRSISAEIQRLTDDIAQGRSDDLHFDIARSRMGSQYVATWLREFRRGGPGVILRKLRNLRPYHATLVARMLGIKR